MFMMFEKLSDPERSRRGMFLSLTYFMTAKYPTAFLGVAFLMANSCNA